MFLMDIKFYEEETDRLIDLIVGNNYVNKCDLNVLIDTITNIIYDSKLTLKDNNDYDQIKIFVSYFVNNNFSKLYLTNKATKKINIFTIKDQNQDNLLSEEQISIIKNSGQLMTHAFDQTEPNYTKKKYIRRLNRIIELKNIPQHVQKSPQWFKDRDSCLTATAIASVLNEDKNKYPIEILLDKCGLGAKFTTNKFTFHGTKYEQIANMIYCYRNNIQVGEYGLIKHNILPIGASPDGICDKKTLQGDKLSGLVGRLLEIKCPYLREIQMTGEIDGDICPHYYWIQVQVQEEVTDLDECDFLQCKIEEYEDREEFIRDTHEHTESLSKKYNLEKGCIIQLFLKDKINGDTDDCLFSAKHIYPPKIHMTPSECDKWIIEYISEFHNTKESDLYVFDRVIYWKLTKINCTLILRDKEWFNSKVPIIEQFWEYIQFYRKNKDKLDILVEYLAKLNIKRTKEIFEYIHKQYQESFDLNLHSRKKMKFTKPLYNNPSTYLNKIKSKTDIYIPDQKDPKINIDKCIFD
jgi:putative phage-type endonuclease